MITSQEDLQDYFKFQCEKGMESRGLTGLKEYEERIEYESKVIQSLGFVPYFLVVSDFVAWARRSDILVGAGRGSGAGSLVCYCLHITEVDPLQYGLIFERFLNPHRSSPPDLDLDFPKEQRQLVIDYVTNKYGVDKVCQIGTIGTMKAKQTIQKVTSGLGHPIPIGEKLRKLLLPPEQGFPRSLEESYEKVPELAKYRDTKTAEGEILHWADKFEERVATTGVHPSGTLISDVPLWERLPLYAPKKENAVASQWDMNEVEEVGLVKFDFLGLMTLSKMKVCLDLIEERHDIKIDIDYIPKDDIPTFELLCSGDLLGIFQLETSASIQQLAIEIQPKSIDDIAVIVAMHRPGPLSSGQVDTYLRRRKGEEPVEFIHENVADILEETYGTYPYQENVMMLSMQLCGFTMENADVLRKAIGKKSYALMEKMKTLFVQGAQKVSGLSQSSAEEVFEDIEKFASYSFNKSHAVAYAHITYQTAYLKANYPVEFLTACMSLDAGDKDQMIKYLGECRRLGIEILPPDVNKSREGFAILDNSTVLFGLEPIKNIGAKPVQEILSKRRVGGAFENLLNFCHRCNLSKVNKLKVQSLIRSGAFDAFEETRASMLEWLELYWLWMKQNNAYLKRMNTYQARLFRYNERLGKIEQGEKLKPLKEPSSPDVPNVPEIIESAEMEREELLKAEHELLNYFVSGHPLENVDYNRIRTVDQIEALVSLPDKSYTKIICLASEVKEIVTKKSQKRMAFVQLEDMTGRVECVVFPNIYIRAQASLKDAFQPLLVEGQLEIVESEEGGAIAKIIARSIDVVNIPKKDTVEKFNLEIASAELPAFTKQISEKLTPYRAKVSITFDSGLSADIGARISLKRSKLETLKKIRNQS